MQESDGEVKKGSEGYKTRHKAREKGRCSGDLGWRFRAKKK